MSKFNKIRLGVMFYVKLFFSRSIVDIYLVLSFLGWLFCSALFVFFDVGELLLGFVRKSERLQIDEFIAAFVMAGIFGMLYGFVKINNLRAEIEKRRKIEQRNLWLSHHDALTGLRNRRSLDSLISNFSLDESESHVHAFVIDLDGFKDLNDLMGHQAGDFILARTARIITDVFSGMDAYIFRTGGDEFLVLLFEDYDESQTMKLANRLIKEIDTPSKYIDVSVVIGASVGLSSAPMDTRSMRDLLMFSDLAMYHAKKEGKNTAVRFKQEMHESVQRRKLIEKRLRIALADSKLVPYFQPIMNLRTGDVEAFEALARWNDGDESISPSLFIKVAEDCGLISELTDDLLLKACVEASRWPSGIRLSFNLSPTQLSDRLLSRRIIDIVLNSGFDPRMLELEITESALIQKLDTASVVLLDLAREGINIVLDDFGTGYSSLAQLSQLHFDKVKIDKGFICNLESDEKQKKVTRAIIGLSHGLGLPATGEGVERETQSHILRKMGCDYAQGYLMGKPMHGADIEKFLIEKSLRLCGD